MGQNKNGTVIVMELGMSVEEFLLVKDQFLIDFAGITGIEVKDIEITKIEKKFDISNCGKGRITIDLNRRLLIGGAVRLLSAEVSADKYTPFALVSFSTETDPEIKIRLDLDKNVFLDHLDNETEDCAVRNCAVKISVLISDAICQHFSEEVNVPLANTLHGNHQNN